MATYINPIIPEYITVHLGKPDQPAQNVQVPFVDYVKNVASSEIYPTWPENAIRANIYAITTYALNRIYTEWYRTRGYDFDITNSTAYDQAFVFQRDVFDNISKIVDELFNDYIVKSGSIEPYATKFCNGTTVTCNGLSQWGTVYDANNGLTPYQMMQKYYGEDINIVKNAPVQNIYDSYPGIPLKLGSDSNQVLIIQQQLNRIRRNYPSITYIPNPRGVFNSTTEKAVKDFQSIFGLTPDGIVGKQTWYKIKMIYNGVKQLAELSSEGLTIEELKPVYPTELSEGMTGDEVKILQYYLEVLAYFNQELMFPTYDGVFGPETTQAVKTFQIAYGLPATGVVDENTWNVMSQAYTDLINSLPEGYSQGKAKIYPGLVLVKGMENSSVKDIQTYLSFISKSYPSLPAPNITGYFGDQTYNSVIAFQRLFGLPTTGTVGNRTWVKLATVYNKLKGF